MKLAAVLAVRDEAAMVEPCLALLDFVDELVVVVDARSTDATESIARRYTDRVFVRTFDDFAAQKNFAIEQSTADWILVVDADERVPPVLAAEIRAAIERAPAADAFTIPFRNFFYGREMRHGGWQEQQVRLIRRRAARYEGDVHERFPADVTTAQLREAMWHFSHRAIADNLHKTASMGDVQAGELMLRGSPAVSRHSLARTAVSEVFSRLVRARGYRDGLPGFIESLYQAFSMFSVQAMVWEKQQEPSITARYFALEDEVRQETLSHDHVGNVDLHRLKVGPGDRVVDVGCGDGGVSRQLASAGLRVLGVEPVPELRAAFLVKAGALAGDHLDVTDGTADRLPFADGSLPAIVMTEVLEHLPQPAAALTELRRVIAPEGVLCLSIPTAKTEHLYRTLHPRYFVNTTHERIISAGQLRREIEQAGFRVLHLEGRNFDASVSWVFHALLHSEADHTGLLLEHLWVDRWLGRGWRVLDVLGVLEPAFRLGNRLLPKSLYVYCAPAT